MSDQLKIETMLNIQDVNYIKAGLSALNERGVSLQDSANIVSLYNRLNTERNAATSVNLVESTE